jgi:hypothetical protein
MAFHLQTLMLHRCVVRQPCKNQNQRGTRARGAQVFKVFIMMSGNVPERSRFAFEAGLPSLWRLAIHRHSQKGVQSANAMRAGRSPDNRAVQRLRLPAGEPGPQNGLPEAPEAPSRRVNRDAGLLVAPTQLVEHPTGLRDLPREDGGTRPGELAEKLEVVSSSTGTRCPWRSDIAGENEDYFINVS